MNKKILKRIKMVVSSALLCLLSVSTTTFATPNINENIDSEINNIEGYSYTYENAPEKVRLEHEENCKSVGIEPKADDPIFVPKSAAEEYNIPSSNTKENDIDAYGLVNNFKDGYNLTYDDSAENVMRFLKINGGTYYINKSTLVGYNHITKGKAVELLQVLLNRAAKSGKANSVIVDGIFGPASHSSLIKFQKANKLSVDATAGRNTWTAFRAYFDIFYDFPYNPNPDNK